MWRFTNILKPEQTNKISAIQPAKTPCLISPTNLIFLVQNIAHKPSEQT